MNSLSGKPRNEKDCMGNYLFSEKATHVTNVKILCTSSVLYRVSNREEQTSRIENCTEIHYQKPHSRSTRNPKHPIYKYHSRFIPFQNVIGDVKVSGVIFYADVTATNHEMEMSKINLILQQFRRFLQLDPIQM